MSHIWARYSYIFKSKIAVSIVIPLFILISILIDWFFFLLKKWILENSTQNIRIDDFLDSFIHDVSDFYLIPHIISDFLITSSISFSFRRDDVWTILERMSCFTNAFIIFVIFSSIIFVILTLIFFVRWLILSQFLQDDCIDCMTRCFVFFQRRFACIAIISRRLEKVYRLVCSFMLHNSIFTEIRSLFSFSTQELIDENYVIFKYISYVLTDHVWSQILSIWNSLFDLFFDRRDLQSLKLLMNLFYHLDVSEFVSRD